MLAILAGCPDRGAGQGSADKKGDPSKMSGKSAIEIVPGKAIGELRLGARLGDIPKQAKVTGEAGEVDGVFFVLADGRVDDVWIDDLRKLGIEVRFAGRVIPRDAALGELKAIFGPCEKVEGVKGGAFFNCAAGVTLGCDAEETGSFVQIRLKRR
jgi:hypothetical protein